MNDFNNDFYYNCPDNKVMTGMSSENDPSMDQQGNQNRQGSQGENNQVFNNNNNYRETGWQDRRFKAACCMVHSKYIRRFVFKQLLHQSKNTDSALNFIRLLRLWHLLDSFIAEHN